ncbi:DnaT-like ssDNA-binding domain-containing protein [Pseudomonas sp. Marseille-P9899]|uniref:DnaT-like ssDNA-binding domain-containing protein n=1 Tax=Pseudomonas sp. Marseille-P9899 TaxID=2730401 RepID=UPI00158B429D|nr:DnaT-like ssDNA-binding domain-containing protein [Pseudomonas sp. Marseille-P9899]
MARIRTIKPEFWTSEQVMECSALARLLFIGIWNFCDDAGNHPMSAKTLKALVFPGDDITSAQVEGMLGELQSNGLISLYEHSSKQYLHVNGWHHQKIDRPTYKHPVFVERSQGAQPPSGDGSPSDRRGLDEGSSSDDRVLTPGKEGEGKGSTHSPREPFEMTLEWVPDQVQLEAYARFSGMAVEQFTPEAISGFVMHHDAKGLAQTEAQWVAALVGWVKRDAVKGAKVVRLRAGDAPGAFDDEDTSWLQGGAS